MEKPRGLLKYYIFFGVLLVATGLAAGYTLSKSASAKEDAKTTAKSIEIANKLDSFVQKNGQLPSTLDDAGLNSVPTTITYTKTDGGYRLCTNYHNKAVNYNPALNIPVPYALNPEFAGITSAGSQSGVNTYLLVYSHKSGQNCQTLISPSSYPDELKKASAPNSPATSSSSAQQDPTGLFTAKCGNGGAVFELKVETAVKSVDSTQGILTLNTTNAKLTDKNKTPLTSLSSVKYDDVTSVYDAKCKKATSQDVDNLKAGASVTVYLYSHDSSFADQIEM